MMKFFRKYNKQMLAFMMVALMVVFIGGSALESLLTPRTNPVVARSNYGPITLIDQQIANDETQLLDRMGMNWKQPVGPGAAPLEPVDWILLLREAEKLGTRVGIDAVRASMADSAVEESILDVARRTRNKPEVVLKALADLRTIQRTVSAIGGATTPSEAQLRIATRDALESVTFRAVVAPAKAFLDESAAFSDEEINKQFTAYRDKEPGEGLSFGYFLPPSIKVQYIAINHAAVAAASGVANLESKAKTYYEQKKTTDLAFRRPADVSADPAAPPPDPYLSFEEAKDKAIEGLRKQQAIENAAKLADWLLQAATEPFFDVERDKSGYRPAPANVAQTAHYNEIVGRIPTQLNYAGAVAVEETNFFALQDAVDVPRLGNAAYQPPAAPRQAFKDLLFRNQAFLPQVPDDDRSGASEYLAFFQTCPVALTDPITNDMFIIRVVASKPGHPPESVDEVRDKVVADLRTQRAYEAALKRAESLKQAASQSSLKEVAEADQELSAYKSKPEGAAAGYFEPAPMVRVPQYMASRGRDPGGVFAGMGLGRLPNDIVDAIFALERSEDKSKVFEMKDRASVIVVQWVETKLAPQDEFDTLRKDLVQQLADAQWRRAAGAWLDPKQVRARTGFALGRE